MQSRNYIMIYLKYKYNYYLQNKNQPNYLSLLITFLLK